MIKQSVWKRIRKSKSIALIFVTAVIIVLFRIINSSYLNPNSMRGIMYVISYTGIIAVGMGCLLISGAVDLGAGGTGCFAGVFIALLMQWGIPWPAAIVLTLMFGAAAGLINAFFANILNFMPFIATIGMGSVWSGLALVISKGTNIAISQKGFYEVSAKYILGVPAPFVAMIVLFLVYGFILTNTPFGREIYMCGGNRAAARLAGIKPKKRSTILFVNCSVISSLAGIFVASYTHLGAPTNVTGMELDAIAASVLGGISFSGGSGGLLGTFIALLLINCFNTGLQSAGFPPYWQVAAQGFVLLIALLADYFSEKSRISGGAELASASAE